MQRNIMQMPNNWDDGDGDADENGDNVSGVDDNNDEDDDGSKNSHPDIKKYSGYFYRKRTSEISIPRFVRHLFPTISKIVFFKLKWL